MKHLLYFLHRRLTAAYIILPSLRCPFVTAAFRTHNMLYHTETPEAANAQEGDMTTTSSPAAELGGEAVKPYKYSPIAAREQIRCLALEPAQDADQPIVCTLKTYRLDNLPDFEAVSYAWGTSGTMSCAITCDKRSKFVTPNLAAALRQCRLPDRERTLWADSICIDRK